MVEDKQIKADYFSPTDPIVYHLPKTIALREVRLKHERLCGDLYVAYELTGKLDYWEAPRDYDDFGLKPDRQMIFDGKIVFWEVDRGTEDYYTEKGIKGKMERYVALSRSKRDRRFHVCFTTIAAKQTAEARCRTIFDLACSYHRADQFLVTLHKWAVDMPEHPCFLSDKSPMGVSLLGAT